MARRIVHDPVGSSGLRAGRDLERADVANAGKNDGITFRTLGSALGFYFSRALALQAPNSRHPRTETAPDGSEAIVSVDGGKGSSLDETMAVLNSIRSAMQLLSEDRIAYDYVSLAFRDGLSMEAIGRARGVSATTVSVHLGRGKAFLSGTLRAWGIIYGGSWTEDRHV